jgi:hypothetical protein
MSYYTNCKRSSNVIKNLTEEYYMHRSLKHLLPVYLSLVVEYTVQCMVTETSCYLGLWFGGSPHFIRGVVIG